MNDSAATPENLSGTIERFVFKSEESGFSVAVISNRVHRSIFVIGHLAGIHPGQQIEATGTWVTHPKFGRQFQIQSFTQKIPTTLLGISKYLSSGLIKGIGVVYAQKMVDHFGADILTIIENEPERLHEIEGIGPKRAEMIAASWQDQKHVSSLMIFLQEKGVSTAYATKIYKKYGQTAMAVLKENPYRLAEDIWGIGFKTADKIAQQLGCPALSRARIKAAIVHLIANATSSGHVYCQIQPLKEQLYKLLELDFIEHESLVKYALHELYQEEKIKLITHDDQHFITLSSYYYVEKNCAATIKNLLNHPSSHTFDLQKLYHQLAVDDGKGVVLNEEQQKAVLATLQSKITIITGGPGTGKTTLVKKLLMLLEQQAVRYQLAAPTGRAAKRMMEGTGRHAMTLHRLLEFDVSTMQFAHNEKNALKTDFLIIDEASMLDMFLMHAVLKALPHTAHLVLIGDIDQLPSVGAGNVLNDMIESGVVSTLRLKHIFRQAQDSLIITNAHRVNHGEFPSSSTQSGKKDFIFIKENDPQNLFAHLEQMIKHKLGRLGFKPEQSMVLVPMNRGIAGTFTINHQLQSLLNPGEKPTVQSHGTAFKVGDRVMQIRNNYDKLVFNGDVGSITNLLSEDHQITVTFGDREVVYEWSELDELVLAYAISIHKSQGSEYDVAIIPLFMQHFILLQRNLLYTAITRAKKLCILIGQPKAIALAIKNNKGTVRHTFLKQFLTSDLSCR
jgi:exodeoxyribonuclease V alpha subunit